MKLTRHLYTFTTADREQIEALGYIIDGLPPNQRLETLLPSILPNFDLRSLLEVVEEYFAHTTSLPIIRRIIYSTPNQSFRVLFQNDTQIADEAVVFDRNFYWHKSELFVQHNYCLVPLPHQGKGLIKPIFQASLQQYVNMGVRKIIVHAGLGGGGYTWARHGFVAINRNEVQSIVTDAHNRLSVKDLIPVDQIFKKYYSDYPAGTDFPMILWASLPGMKDILRGSDWHGELDLHNSGQFRNFSNYVFRT